MTLSVEEKKAGRVFLDRAQGGLTALMESSPPTYKIPSFLSIYRHLCAKRNMRSTALELKEKYELSPSYVVYPTTDGYEVAEQSEEWAKENVPDGYVFVPAGRFGFIYREGKCRGCQQTARSPAGKLVDAWDRPPSAGRVGR